MAAPDPKQILLDNKVLIGIYAAALVPIPLWFVLVAGSVRGDAANGGGPPGSFGAAKAELKKAKATADDMAGRIGNAENPLYTQQDIEHLQQKKDLYEKQLEELRARVAQADVELEKWFDAECTKGLKEGQNPAASEYLTEWNSQIVKLREKYKAIVTGDAGEDLVYGDPPAGGQERAWQKRFWIQQAVLDALVDANKAANDPHAAARLSARIEFSTTPPQGPNDPPRPYDPLPARVQVKVPFTRLPVVVRELLARSIPLRVTGVRVDLQAPFTIEHTAPKFSVDGREGYFPLTSYFARIDTNTTTAVKPADLKDDARWIWEPPVVAELSLEVYDFKKFEAPKPAEGEGGEGGN